jgi:hypothetical protein
MGQLLSHAYECVIRSIGSVVRDPVEVESGNRANRLARLATRRASSGGAAAPQTISKVMLVQGVAASVNALNIQSTANAPVTPSSASATMPYALPPTMFLVAKPVRIPISSNQTGSIKLSRRRWNRATTLEREPMRVWGQNGRFPDIRCSAQPLND